MNFITILIFFSSFSCTNSSHSLRNRRFKSKQSHTKEKRKRSKKETLKKSTVKNSTLYNSHKKRTKQFINDWKGTPYRYGGTNKYGIDCSAFSGKYYSTVFGLSIKRTTKLQYGQGIFIRKTNLRHGDLVFFKNSRKASKVDHVGVYLGNNRFVHASTSRGVCISNLNSDYYKRSYVGAKRLLN